METVLRDACDACHKLKTKCPSDGPGPCSNCRRKGQLCQYSPRKEMGRPRLNPDRPRSSSIQKRRPGRASTSPNPPRVRSSSDLQTFEPQKRAFSAVLGSQNHPGPGEPLGFSYHQPPSHAMLSELSLSDMSPWNSGLYDPALPEDSNNRPESSWQHTGLRPAAPMFLQSEQEMPLYSPPILHLPSASEPQPAGYDTSRNSVDTQVPPLLGPNDAGLGGVETYSKLTNILFSLEMLAGGSRMPEEKSAESSSSANIFRAVSSLCDIFRSGELAGLRCEPGQDPSPAITLLATVISTIVNIYHGEMDRLIDLWKSHGGDLGTGQHLRLYLDAITMEFHLGQLRDIVFATQMGLYDATMMPKLGQLSATVGSFVQTWRASRGAGLGTVPRDEVQFVP